MVGHFNNIKVNTKKKYLEALQNLRNMSFISPNKLSVDFSLKINI
jgi:hypothetical protein